MTKSEELRRVDFTLCVKSQKKKGLKGQRQYLSDKGSSGIGFGTSKETEEEGGRKSVNKWFSTSKLECTKQVNKGVEGRGGNRDFNLVTVVSYLQRVGDLHGSEVGHVYL